MTIMTTCHNLDGRLVRIVDLNDWGVARVERQLHTDQRLQQKILRKFDFTFTFEGFRNPFKADDHHLYSVWIRSSRSLDSVSKASSAGVDVKGVLDQAGLPTKEHHVKRCVPSRWDYLDSNEVMTRYYTRKSSPYH